MVPRLFSRRQFLRVGGAGFGSAIVASGYPVMAFSRPKLQGINSQRPPNLGTTFSQLQCWYLKIDPKETFRHVCQLGLNRIRLCSYWHEIEKTEGQFDFSMLDWLLKECDRHNIEVVLTVGMKAPRWPEYQFPEWLSDRVDTKNTKQPLDYTPEIADRTLNFVNRVVMHTREAPALRYWQVENEPFARMDITGGRYLSPEFIQQEVRLVRSLALPTQKILLTNAIALPDANSVEDDHAFLESVRCADAVGINVYSKVPIGPLFYLEPKPSFWAKLQEWQTRLVNNGKEAWIAEAQAEPWEHNQLVAMNRANHPSSSPRQATSLVTTLTGLGYDTVMLWGCEYWYWNKLNNRNLWWWTMEQLAIA